MSLLEAYVNEIDECESIESMCQRFQTTVDAIKQCAHSVIDTRFEYAMAQMCFEATRCLAHIETSLRQMSLFIDNSIKKWRDYALIYKEMLKVIAMVTQPVRLIQAAQTNHVTSYLPRTTKLPTSSLFNVIQISPPHITLRCENHAIVKGINPRPEAPSTTTTAATTTPFHYDASFRRQLEDLTKSVISVFEAEKHKRRIYLAHYERLGNLTRLARHINAMQESLALLVHESNDMDSLITQVNDILALIPVAMRESKENCKDYVFNTVNRFTECSTTYTRMLREIEARHLEFDEMQQLEECRVDTQAATTTTTLRGMY